MVLSRGSLADCQAELLVCGVNDTGKVDAGAIGALFQEAGGLLEECLQTGLANGSRLPGSVVLTPPFELAHRGVKGLALVVVRPVPSLDQLRQAAAMVAHQIMTQGWKSLACPALGCGAGALPPAQAAHALLEGLASLLRQGLELELALPRPADYEAYQAVARQLKLL
ncbi:macro domain-containing protein [bacterium]|nr:macro domain-containing protein [bacterium]